MKAIGYVRVSTDKQAEHGVSIAAQAEKISAMAVVHNAELTDILVDGRESAKSLQRPGIERLLALVDGKKLLPSSLPSWTGLPGASRTYANCWSGCYEP